MTVKLSRHILRQIIFLLVLLGFGATSFAFQEDIITSNKNVYKRVTGGAVQGTDWVVVDNLADFDKFRIRDTVLLIQMKGVQAKVPETGLYGDSQDITGAPGRYEFLIIQDTIKSTRTIQFTNPIINSYDVASDVQLIRVPTFYSATVAADLICPPWDSISKTGGVLAMIVGRKLTLNANINVSGKGFRGGAVESGDGFCSEINTSVYRKFAYDASFTNSGFKGEGMVSKAWINFTTQLPIFPGFSKGKGANFNGGGGGNGRFSGGAGGSHIGTGGKGGKELKDVCTDTDNNLGGWSVTGSLVEGGLFLGGGGGGSTYSGGGTAVKGGAGGGIVIILANEISGNNFAISADGESPAGTASGTAGAGGGGGGGSIALYVETFSSTNLNLSVKGGQGGRSNGYLTDGGGEGGGGGGGLIWTNLATPANIITSVAGGPRGLNNGLQTASNGNPGLKTTSNIYLPKLNGFLFNTIRSSVSSNLVDSVCSNNKPYTILGTNPVGGSGFYTYLWQKKNDSGGSPIDINPSDVRDYVFPSPEADTFFIRRIVKDDITLLTDTSKWLKVIVQPAIKNNIVNIYSHITSLTDTICFNDDPALIDQKLPGDLIPPTAKNLFFAWQDSANGATWGTVRSTIKSYDPPAGLQKTTWYRRKVTSGRCIDSSAIVRINVIPKITGNSIANPADTICHGGVFADLLGAAGLGGGDNTYRYQWQYSTTGTDSWANATGSSTLSGYNPDETSPLFPGKLYFRRNVFSGSHNVCADSSLAAVRVDWPAITGNTITADEITCSGVGDPALISGPEPLNGAGSGTFLYTWQDSSRLHSWQNIAGFIKVPGTNYDPPVLTDTTAYRRIAYSSKCIDNSPRVLKMVHKPITNFNVVLFSGGWDTTLCSGSVPKRINGLTPAPSGGSGNPANNIYQWQYSPAKTGIYTDISGAVAEDYQPGSLANASVNDPVWFYYKRKVTNGACSVVSDSAVAVKVLPKISNNIVSADQAICFNTAPATLTGPVLTGGAGGTPTWLWQQSTDAGTTWTSASGGNAQNYAPPQLTIPTRFRRVIFSGPADCCKDTSNVLGITINPLPVAAITAASGQICEGTPGQSFELNITGSAAFPMTVTYREKTRLSSSDIQAPLIAGPSPASVTVSPLVPANPVTDSLTFTYSLVSVRDNNGCLATAMSGSEKILVYELPVAGAGPDEAVCGPVFKLDGSRNVGTGVWSYPGVPVTASTPNGDDLEVTVDLPVVPQPWFHKHRFYYTVTNWNCISKDSADITFYLQPDAANAGADRTIWSFDKQIVLPYPSVAVGEGAWEVVSGGAFAVDDSTFAGLSAGENVFRWKIVTRDDIGCVSADEVVYKVEELLIPQGFSPNEDGINDIFEIKGLDTENSRVTLTIVNSAGAEVYRTTNINDEYKPWDGISKGNPVPDGTYYYLIIIETTKENNNTPPHKTGGFVVLKRDFR